MKRLSTRWWSFLPLVFRCSVSPWCRTMSGRSAPPFRCSIAHALVGEIALYSRCGTTGDVHRAAAQTLIHRQDKAETVNAALVAECQLQGFTQRQAGNLLRCGDRRCRIAFYVISNAETAVGSNLSACDRRNRRRCGSCCRLHGPARPSRQSASLWCCAQRGIAVAFCPAVRQSRPVKVVTVVAQPRDGPCFRQRNIGDAIADDIAVGFIPHLQPDSALTSFTFGLRQSHSSAGMCGKSALHQIPRPERSAPASTDYAGRQSLPAGSCRYPDRSWLVIITSLKPAF